MADREDTSKDDAKKTPPDWGEFEDARKNKKSGKYPNVWTRKTRSGHVLIFDDSEGGEHITLQHRGGPKLQFLSDGAGKLVVHNGMQTIVFGENRIWVSGAQDITVEGDASIKCKGNYNATIDGDANFTAKGAFNITAKSMNQTISENYDIAAGSKMEKIQNSSVSQVHGALTMSSKYGFTAVSTGDAVAIGAATDVAIASASQTVIQSGGQTSIKASGTLAMDSGSQIRIQSGDSKAVGEVLNMKAVPAPAKQPSGTGTV
jgi:hypothetical protein